MKFKSGEDFVKNLVSEYCPEPTVSSTIRLETYYKKAHGLFHQALDFVKQGNDARAYIELMRYAQLVMALSTHNSYSLKQYEKDKNLNKRRLNNAITKLEELKPKLIKQYNEEIKREQQRLQQQENEPSTPDMADVDEEKEQKDTVPSAPPDLANDDDESNGNGNGKAATSSPNRWNNLKIESSPYYQPAPNVNASGSSTNHNQSHSNNNQMDAIFKKPPPSLTPIYVPEDLVSGFIKFAESNTKRDIETCGVLTGKYLHEQDAYIITYVIIPKQKGSANTVQTLHEEELIGVQEKYGVITLGWIHTHPSQTCFLSSVDMHCQLSYQIMMPNAIAIVYAPTDKTETFTLTKHGISILSNCSCQGFHRHENVNGLYQKATHVHYRKSQKCKFIDLRK